MNSLENTLVIKPKYTLSEELISAISHGIGVLLAIAGMVLCIVKAAMDGNTIGVVSSSLYGSFMIILYLMSTLYHSFKPTVKAKKVFRIFDHCSIFLLIFGTYVPYTLVTLKGALGWTLFGIVLGAAILGIVLNAVNLEKFKKLSMVCYLVMGWTIIGAIKQVYNRKERYYRKYRSFLLYTDPSDQSSCLSEVLISNSYLAPSQLTGLEKR